MASKDRNYHLPNWKKMTSGSRGVDSARLEEHLSLLILETNKVEVKETLLKLRIGNDYDTNAKTLGGLEVQRLKDTLEFLTKDTEGLTKEGLIYNILKAITSKLPHKCENCKSTVTRDPSLENTSKCAGCGTQLCIKYNKDRHDIVYPVGERKICDS